MVTEIEKALREVPAEPAAVQAAVEEKYRVGQVQSPGLTPANWAQALALALKS